MTIGAKSQGSMPAHLPSAVSDQVGVFDRFASASSRWVSRAPFFAGCVLLVVVWAPSMVLVEFTSSQLLINTPTTVVTFLLVALLQNTQTRADASVQAKLNAIAEALSELLEGQQSSKRRSHSEHIRELRDAVGLENKESA